MVTLDISIWIGALLTIAVYSLVFKYTIIYRITEYTFVGLGLGYSFVLGWENVMKLGVDKITGGNISFIVPLLVGLGLYARFVARAQYSWLGRYPLALMVGVGTGVAVRGNIHADLVKQVIATAKPLFGSSALETVNNIIFPIIFITGLIYFIFTIPLDKKPGGSIIRRIGRIGLMANFGAMIANTTMSRYARLIGRMQFLLFEWLGL